MAVVTVVPETFAFVLFDGPELHRLVAETADLVGFPREEPLRLEVDERSPLGRTAVSAVDPVTITAESGALEDATAIARSTAAEAVRLNAAGRQRRPNRWRNRGGHAHGAASVAPGRCRAAR